LKGARYRVIEQKWDAGERDQVGSLCVVIHGEHDKNLSSARLSE